MSLAEEDIQYIKEHIPQWLAGQSLASPPVVYELELRERTIRVEEELKHQRELMQQGFQQMDKRFEAMQQQMDKRFEQIGKRFEQVDKHFEQVDKRFAESLQHSDKIAGRHDRMQWLIFITMIGYFFKEQIVPLLG
jgi:DNA anti-recombination protein RmuC